MSLEFFIDIILPAALWPWDRLKTLTGKSKIKCSRYRPGVAKRVGRGIALLFHDRGTRRGWLVTSTPRPHFIPGKDPVPIFTGGWVGHRADLGGRKISFPPGFDPEPSNSWSITIPTELPDPQQERGIFPGESRRPMLGLTNLPPSWAACNQLS